MQWSTHEISNQFDELVNYNLLETDKPLQHALQQAGADWAVPRLRTYASQIGSEAMFALSELANRQPPRLQTFDRRGRRIDTVEFHPSWHSLMAALRSTGSLSLPFRDTRRGRWAAALAALYLHAQVEAGSLCPSVMTLGCIPLLQREPALWSQLCKPLYSDEYDARDLPLDEKRSVYVGMGMTEKQGGSDVRANTTQARPTDAGGRGQTYTLRGHKWFFSAPMCDAHLVTALDETGQPSCFYVPRWRPDGSRNAVQIQRLKEKVGNRSNASSEVEFQDAWGVLMGEPGRGIPTIIEMANYTRLSCVMGSAAILRQALVQAIAYARRRQAFGRELVRHPLMRAVLADLALESEAALVLLMRLAQAFEDQDSPLERAWVRLVTPAAKFWVCKRAVELSGEAMEVFGGNGYVDEGPMARLFREAPVNSIWEGSGNVMCLDVMRAIARDSSVLDLVLEGLGSAARDDAALALAVDTLRKMAQQPTDCLEGQGRLFVQHLVLCLQAALLRSHAPSVVADAFIATRLGATGWGRVAGALDPAALDVGALLERSLPA